MRCRVKPGMVVNVTGQLLYGGEDVELSEAMAWEIRHKVDPVDDTDPSAPDAPPADLSPADRVAWLTERHAKWAATGLEPARVAALATQLDEARQALARPRTSRDGAQAPRAKPPTLTDKD